MVRRSAPAAAPRTARARATVAATPAKAAKQKTATTRAPTKPTAKPKPKAVARAAPARKPALKSPAVAKSGGKRARPSVVPPPPPPIDDVSALDTVSARTPSQRDRRFNLLLHTACLKSGTAAAFSSITAKVPLLGRLAPVLMATVGEKVALPGIQKQLVRDVLDLYALDLSDAEERGVILLSTGASLGMQSLSGQMVDRILAQFGVGYLRLVTTRMLPLASIATDIAAAIATTYTVGKRAQILCSLPGTGARNLSELLGGLSVIDQRRLFIWSAEALRMALRPFRSVLLSLR